MGFQEILVSLISWKNDKHKFTSVSLGLVLCKLLLMAKVNIYLCLIFVFIFRILRIT